MGIRVLLLIAATGTGIACAQTSQPTTDASDTKVIATVLGAEITARDADRLTGLIVQPLFARFVEENNVAPTAEEIDAFVAWIEKANSEHRRDLEGKKSRLTTELRDVELSSHERADKERELHRVTRWLEQEPTTLRRMANVWVQRWKTNKALYAKYGGRVIYQQAGPEPLDAYRAFLEEQERKGAFKILDEQYRPGFWKYFTDERMHTFYPENMAAKAINRPWWLMDEPLGVAEDRPPNKP